MPAQYYEVLYKRLKSKAPLTDQLTCCRSFGDCRWRALLAAVADEPGVEDEGPRGR